MNTRKRFWKTVIIVFRIVLDFKKEFVLIKKKGYVYAQEKMRERHEKSAKQLYETAIYLQGAFIKACQYISARPDAFPEPYIKTLSALQDDVPPENFNSIKEVIKQEYGNYKKIFHEIEKDPIASASLAQVHKAQLKNGNTVILKVLKPGIEQVIDIDFAILYHVTKLLSKLKVFKERPDFISFMDNAMQDFIRVTSDELDFKREADIARQFKEQFKKFSFVKVPYVYEKYSTHRIIVMEYVEGDKIYDIDKWKQRNNNPQLIAKRLIELYVDQFLFSKMIHYDPHPGNIIITNNSNIILLDFGMAGQISEEMRNGFWIILEAAMIRDFRKIIDVLEDLDFIKKGNNKYSLLPVIEFFFDKILDVVRLDREALHSIDFSPIRDDLLKIIDSNVFNIPQNWAFSGKTLSTLYGIIGSLDPDFKIYEEIKSTVISILKNNFNLFINEISKRIYDGLKTYMFTILTLPGRVENFMDNIERGSINIKIDDTAIINKMERNQVYNFKFTFLILGLISGITSFVFYENMQTRIAIVLLIFAGISLIISLVYNRRTLKGQMRKQIEKMF